MPTQNLINQQSVAILLAKKFRQNYFQSILHLPQKGVTEEFSEDTNAGYIRVARPLPHGIKGRKLGASVNGGNFNGDEAFEPKNQEYDLPLLYVYDGNVDIAEVRQDMLPLNIVEGEAMNISGEISTQINASTIASQLVATFNKDISRSTSYIKTLPSTETETSVRDVLLESVTTLDDGDVENGVQFFPADQREIIARPMFVANLFKGKNILIGGSNYAQELLARGTISPGTYLDNGSSYKGEFMNVPLYSASSAIWSATEEWINMGDNAMTPGALNGVQAIVCAAMGTARGIAMPESFKQIDSPRGAGIRIQPLVRWGVECWLPDSVVVIASNKYTNPATADAKLSVVAPGTRA